jgi:organic hydroperoxide reductase OsmC/OhrA
VRSHSYEVTTEWTGNTGSGTSGYRDYSRSLETTTSGRDGLPGSSDPAFRGDPTRWNPELLLLTALAQCHLLSYLHVCVEAGVVVTAYRDTAAATMVEDGAGGGRFTGAVLRPHVTVADASMVARAASLHAEASARCFIAASVAFPVQHEPVVVADGTPTTTASAVPPRPGPGAGGDRPDRRAARGPAGPTAEAGPAGRGPQDGRGGRTRPGPAGRGGGRGTSAGPAAGLDADVAEQVWRAMVAGFVDLELRVHADGREPSEAP